MNTNIESKAPADQPAIEASIHATGHDTRGC